jgi:hypothetical protein|uniref:Methyltransferase FkbM domain-containing protein n=1 Tax=viral metagenome TaxID=1070528 RepID=A0A6C0LDB1_9ZZZZ
MELRVYKSEFPKERIGKNNDGGYVICNIPNIKYDVLISGGISNDTTFEDQFLNKFSDIDCYAYDGTILESPSTNPKFHWIKKNIGFYEKSNETNLHNLINSNKSIFIKMDIEGYELQWIESLSLDQLQNISQLVIEFHSAFTDRHKKMFQKLNEVFALVHLHGNNFKYDLVNNIPYFFECTYINKKYLTKSLEFNTDTIPSTLDQPNLVSKPDVFLNFEPYVHNNIRLPRTLKLGPKGFY